MRRHLEVGWEFDPQNDYIAGLRWIADNSCDLYTFRKGRIFFRRLQAVLGAALVKITEPAWPSYGTVRFSTSCHV